MSTSTFVGTCKTVHGRLTIDLKLADEGLGEVSGDSCGNACCGLQRGQESHVGHLQAQSHELVRSWCQAQSCCEDRCLIGLHDCSGQRVPHRALTSKRGDGCW